MTIKELQQRFFQGDPQFGPLPFWWWSGDEVTAERIRWQLQKFRSGGIRQIGIINIAPTGPQFGSVSDRPALFSEDWWALFEVAVREAERLGMRLFFYDQIGFSGSNFPARIVADHPECAGYALQRYANSDILPEGAEVLLETDAYRYIQVRQGFNWLDRRATELLLDRIHGEFERRFGSDLGKTIAGSFQDELSPFPLWSPDVWKQYEATYGESLLEQLPKLFDELPDAETIRRRVYKLAARLAEKSFFMPLAAWHDQYGMILCSDQAGPGRRAEVHGAQRLYLDYFRTHRWYNAAGCDMDGEVKAHASMAHLHGGKRVFLESFHTSGWGGTIEETLHWLVPAFREGATLYSPHAVYYSTRGGWWEWAPPDTGWRQPYFEHYSILADTVSRVCMLLTEGEHVADLAVHYPSYAVTGYMSLADGKPTDHPMQVAANIPNEHIGHIHDTYERLTGYTNRKERNRWGVLRQAKFDFDIVDDAALEKSIADASRLRIAGESFQVLLLCGTTVMDEAALDKVTAWIEAGGRVIAVAVPEEERTLAGATYVDRAEEVVALIESVVERRVEGNGLSLQRQTDEADLFLLLPEDGQLLPMHAPAEQDFKLNEQATYRLRTRGTPQLWDPVSGQVSEVAYERDGEWVTVDVPFISWPAALIVCPHTLPGDTGMMENTAASLVHPANVGPAVSGKPGMTLPADEWQVTAVPTLDNQYGDFDLHTPEATFAPIEVRVVSIAQESDASMGMEAGWHLGSFADRNWTERLWSEAGYWHASSDPNFSTSETRSLVYSLTFGDMSYRTWAGRMGQVPRKYLNLGRLETGESMWARTNIIVPADGSYWIRIESNAEVIGWVDGQEIALSGGTEEQTAMLQLKQGNRQLKLQATAWKDGLVRAAVEVNETPRAPLPKWIYAASQSSQTTLSKRVVTTASSAEAVSASERSLDVVQVRIVFAARGRAALHVNGTKVTEHGDFNSYTRQGQEEVDVTSWWKSGENELKFVLPEGSGEVFADGVVEWSDGTTQTFCTGEDWVDEQGNSARIYHGSVLLFAETESLWLNPQPHPLPHVGWLMPESVPDPKPLSLHANPEQIGKPVWLRFPLPVGAHRMFLDCKGKCRIWVDGEELSMRSGTVQFPPVLAHTMVAVRVEPEGPFTEADVLRAPIRLETLPATGNLGDWRTALGLKHHSGAVEYETTVELAGKEHTVLALGHVRGTAEVWIDGEPAGVRAWRPYQFDLGSRAKGRARLRIRVTNTLGTHYEVGRPSDNVGGGTYYYANDNDPSWPDVYASGGLFGPVQLFEWEV